MKVDTVVAALLLVVAAFAAYQIGSQQMRLRDPNQASVGGACWRGSSQIGAVGMEECISLGGIWAQ